LPPVIGHRGAARSSPENTLAGLRRARSLGCAWVEFDVRLTADGALVLLHDSRLDRTTDATGRVAAKALSLLRKCDAGRWFGPAFAGEPIPMLEEALALAAELGLGVNIEIKADPGRVRRTAAAVAAVLSEQRGCEPPLLVSSFLPRALAVMRDLVPQVPRGLLLRSVRRGWNVAAARLGCSTLHLDQQAVTPALVAAMRAADFPVLAYTVNDPVRARLLFDWGVTSVFSDIPDIILEIAAEARPYWPPAIAVESAALQRGAIL
jgi:glycerophosphoryl diester phosphodiesterase